MIPESFDLERYLRDGWGIMRGEAHAAEDVVLLFEPEAGRWVAEEQWHRSQKVETQADGCRRSTGARRGWMDVRRLTFSIDSAA